MQEIAQIKMPRLTEKRPIFDHFPQVNVDAPLLIWEQLDNYFGLQQVRGYDGQPPKVLPTGLKQYQMQPGVYGEWAPITEEEMTVRRSPGTFANPIDITECVMERQDKLLGRRLDRIEYILWQLLTYGTFSVSNANGTVQHTDTFPIQTFTSTVSWSNATSSTPLNDFRQVQLLGRGQSVDFGRAAIAYMTRATFNQMVANANAVDLYGKRTAGLGTFNSLEAINQLIAGEDLPTIYIYDQTYPTDAVGGYSLFIPDGYVIVVGQRPAGQPVGEYRFTRCTANPNAAPGSYMRVIDKGEFEIPRTIQVHDGHNGGPVIFYPGAVVTMNVG